MTARIGRWAHLFLYVVGVIALLTMLEVIVYAHNVRVDLTPDRKFTLSQHAEQILDGIKADVEIVAFTRSEDPRNRIMKDLFWRVRERQPRVAWRMLDVNRNPALARQYGADAYGSVVVESGGRRKAFSNVNREDVLMAAILQVTREDKKVVYFLTGHGEHDIEDSDRRKGYTSVRSVLTDEFYEVKPLALVGGNDIPEDASVVVIAGPRTDLLQDEIVKLDAYVRRAGNLMCLIDPGTSPALGAQLARYGIRFPDVMVADGDNSMASGEPLTMRVAEPSTHSLVTTRLSGDPVFSLARAIDVLPDVEDSAYAARAILKTGPNAWTIPSQGAQIRGETDFTPARGDQRGQHVVGVQVVVEKEARPPDKEGYSDEEDAALPAASRIIVFGDSDFADNFFIELLGNKDLFLNSVNWLTAQDQLIAIRPTRKTAGKEQFFLSGRQNYWSFINFTVIQPLVVLAFGAMIFAWRRFR
ncbi:MAG: GldG family protein [Candidatus Binatia bacterium]